MRCYLEGKELFKIAWYDLVHLYQWTCDQWIINPLLIPGFLMEINSAEARKGLLLSLAKQFTCTSKG